MTEQQNQNKGVKLTPEQEKSRRARNIAIGLTVALLVVIFYAVTLVRLGSSVFIRP